MRCARLLLLSIPLVTAGCTAVILSDREPGAGGAGEVPAAYQPPAGRCRVWYPDRAPARQPPVGDCAVLSGQVPPGAVLVRGR